MQQDLLKVVKLKSFFLVHQAQRELLIFLLENNHHSGNYIRLQDALDKCGFEKKVTYKAVDALHKRGWICFYRSSQLRASWIGYNDKLPGEFLRELRTALAQAKEYKDWFDFIVSRKYGDGGTHHANVRTHTAYTHDKVGRTKETAATKRRLCSNGSDNNDVLLDVFDGDAGQDVPEGSRHRRQHRFDPQGLPLR